MYKYVVRVFNGQRFVKTATARYRAVRLKSTHVTLYSSSVCRNQQYFEYAGSLFTPVQNPASDPVVVVQYNNNYSLL